MAAGTEGKWSELISTLYHVSQIKNGEIETEVRGENLSPVVIRDWSHCKTANRINSINPWSELMNST